MQNNGSIEISGLEEIREDDINEIVIPSLTFSVSHSLGAYGNTLGLRGRISIDIDDNCMSMSISRNALYKFKQWLNTIEIEEE